MNRPSDESSRRIIFVQFWELLHTFKQLFWSYKIENHFFVCNFYKKKILLLDLTYKKAQLNSLKVPKQKLDKNYLLQHLTFENVQKGPRPQV